MSLPGKEGTDSCGDGDKDNERCNGEKDVDGSVVGLSEA
jgi:hypothetical protein